MTKRVLAGSLDTVIYINPGVTSVSASAWDITFSRAGNQPVTVLTSVQVATVSAMPGWYALTLSAPTTMSAGAANEHALLHVSANPTTFTPFDVEIELFGAGAGTITSAEISAIVENAVYQRALTEPTGAPSWANMPFDVAIEWIAARNLNRHHQASASAALYSSADSQIASASVNFTSTSANQAQWL